MNFRFGFLFFLISTSAFAGPLIKFDSGVSWECTKFHKPIPLRYGYQYGFFNSFNNSSTTSYLHTFEVQFEKSIYLKAGEGLPNGNTFSWTKELLDGKYAVPAGKSEEVISTLKNDWAVLNHPKERASLDKNEYDFLIGFKLTFDFENNTSNKAGHFTDVACQPYYITWLGDGVVDEKFEICDPADLKKKNWGANGCNSNTGIPEN